MAGNKKSVEWLHERLHKEKWVSDRLANPLFLLVEPRGIEPLAYALRTHRSPS